MAALEEGTSVLMVRKQYVATGYIYDRNTDRFLLIFHKKLDKWLAPGGHLHEGEEPHKGVLREIVEETGAVGRIVHLLETPQVSTPEVAQLPAPFCILHETIPASSREEEHVHLDFVYVVEIDLFEPLTLHVEEASLAKWISTEDIANINGIDTYDNVRRVCRAISALSKPGLKSE